MTPLTDDQLKDVAAIMVAANHVLAEAVRKAAPMKRSTFQSRLLVAGERGFYRGKEGSVDLPPELPEFPADDVPIEQIIDLQRRRFEKRQGSYDAHTWFRIEARDNKAMGIDFHGDPHLDDNGVNWPVLLDNIEIHKRTPGMYGVNIGDSSNNWHGRLAQRPLKEQPAAVLLPSEDSPNG